MRAMDTRIRNGPSRIRDGHPHPTMRWCNATAAPTIGWGTAPAAYALRCAHKDTPTNQTFSAQHLGRAVRSYLSATSKEACLLPLPSWAGYQGMPAASHVDEPHELPPNYVVALDAMYTRLPLALSGCTLLFLGDSVSVEGVFQLADMVGNWSRVSRGLYKDHVCFVWSSGFRVCSLGVSRDLSTPRQPVLGNASACLAPNRNAISTMRLDDVLRWCLRPLGFVPAHTWVVLSVGVHHNIPTSTLVPEVKALIEWLQREAAPNELPACLLWRETLPQRAARGGRTR